MCVHEPTNECKTQQPIESSAFPFEERRKRATQHTTLRNTHHFEGMYDVRCAMCCLNHETHLFVAIGADFIKHNERNTATIFPVFRTLSAIKTFSMCTFGSSVCSLYRNTTVKFAL